MFSYSSLYFIVNPHGTVISVSFDCSTAVSQFDFNQCEIFYDYELAFESSYCEKDSFGIDHLRLFFIEKDINNQICCFDYKNDKLAEFNTKDDISYFANNFDYKNKSKILWSTY